MKSVRIGAGQGFWGDSPFGAYDVVKLGNVQYLCCDALAELTLAILTKSMKKDIYAGWVNDLTLLMKTVLPDCKRKGVKVITNHGGMNPLGALEEVVRIAKELDISGLKIAAVTGDNIFHKIDDLQLKGISFANMETGEPLCNVRDRLMFANAYIGARPIVEALDAGADIVITGRCADSAVFLAPLIYELGWKSDDWDLLASGTVIGHLMECSAQSTGGNFHGNWMSIPRMEAIGYPIAEVYENGEAILTKAEGTGGRVDIETVVEQLVYEVLDPQNYIVPDVVADFTSVQLSDAGRDKVLIKGVKGKPCPDNLKVSMGYQNGWASTVTIMYAWPDALKKAKKAEEIIRYQMKKIGLQPDEIYVEYVGVNSLHGPAAVIPDEDTINEVGLRMSIRTMKKEDAIWFPRLFPSLALNGPPTAGGGGGDGRSRARELIGSWPALIPRSEVEPGIEITFKEV